MAESKREAYHHPLKSVAALPGAEGQLVIKGQHSGNAIAVFTSGGDAQGIPIQSVLLLMSKQFSYNILR